MTSWQVRWLIWSPIAAAIMLTLGTAIVLGCGPYIIYGWLWDTLKDIGPAVAGVWVLVAGLLTLTASGVAVREGRRESLEAARQYRISVIVACECDLKSYEARIAELDLVNQLRDHIARMKDSDPWRNIFRRSLEDYWFSLSRKDPVAIAQLGEAVAVKYFSLAAQARNLSGRLLWMNLTGDAKPADFWIRYIRETNQILLGVMKQCSEVKRHLSELRNAI